MYEIKLIFILILQNLSYPFTNIRPRGELRLELGAHLFGIVWNYFGITGITWKFFELRGKIWNYLEIFGITRKYLELLGNIWNYIILFFFFASRKNPFIQIILFLFINKKIFNFKLYFK